MTSFRRTLSLISNLTLLLISLFATKHLIAATYYVGTCKVGAFGTIQASVNAVPPGSTIAVSPGPKPHGKSPACLGFSILITKSPTNSPRKIGQFNVRNTSDTEL